MCSLSELLASRIWPFQQTLSKAQERLVSFVDRKESRTELCIVLPCSFVGSLAGGGVLEEQFFVRQILETMHLSLLTNIYFFNFPVGHSLALYFFGDHRSKVKFVCRRSMRPLRDSQRSTSVLRGPSTFPWCSFINVAQLLGISSSIHKKRDCPCPATLEWTESDSTVKTVIRTLL
jgi:hypothetical protein